MCYGVIKGNPSELWSVALDIRYLGSDHGKYYIQTYVKDIIVFLWLQFLFTLYLMVWAWITVKI